MNTAYLIQQIEQLLREQDSIYHNTAVRFGLSDTAMRALYLVSETDEVLTSRIYAVRIFLPSRQFTQPSTAL